MWQRSNLFFASIMVTFLWSVATAIPAQVASPVSVRLFGARCDYNPVTGKGADDTAAFDEALAAVSVDGGALYIPPGNCRLTRNLTLISSKSNVTIYGAGMGRSTITRTSVPTPGPGLGIISVKGGGNWTVQDLSLVGQAQEDHSNPFTVYGKGLFFRGVSDVSVFRVEASHLEGEAIYADDDSPRVRFTHNYVHDGHGAGLNVNSSPTTSEDSIVSDNVSVNQGAGAVQVTARSVRVERNVVRQPRNNPTVGADLILIDSSEQFTCEDNVILDSALIATVSAINVWRATGGRMDGTVRGNTIGRVRTTNRNVGAAIHVIDVTGHLLISGNTIYDTGRADETGSPAVRISGAGTTGSIVIESNSFSRGTENSLDYGVIIDSALPASANVFIGPNEYAGVTPVLDLRSRR